MAEPKQQPATEGETEVLVYKMNFAFINSNARKQKSKYKCKKTYQFKHGVSVRSQITRLKLQKSF